MPWNCECVGIPPVSCPCHLKVIGFISGWLGIVWRIVVVALLSTTVSNLTGYGPSIYLVFLIACLTYFVTSFIVNGLFLYGLFSKKRYFLLPYIIVVTLEMVIGIIISSGIIMLSFAINAIGTAFYLLAISILVIGCHFALWLYNILYYKDLKDDDLIRPGKKSNIALTRVHRLDI